VPKCNSQPALLETYGFVYGDVHVPYRVERVAIATGARRKISIRVHPDSQVIVSAPHDRRQEARHSRCCDETCQVDI